MSAEDAVDNILYNTPRSAPTTTSRHILNILVSNEPGVLSRISGLLAARGFNIDSLVVSKTEVPDLSRMTVVLNGQAPVIEQARKQIDDLVPVWAVLDYTHSKIIERELLLAKVWTLPKEHLSDDASAQSFSPLMSTSLQRQALTELARLFQARVVDVSLDSMVLELCAKQERIDAFLNLLKPYGIIEATRTGESLLASLLLTMVGMMAMPRDSVENLYEEMQADSMEEEEFTSDKVDPTMLPPG